jgi:hypothetical protein
MVRIAASFGMSNHDRLLIVGTLRFCVRLKSRSKSAIHKQPGDDEQSAISNASDVALKAFQPMAGWVLDSIATTKSAATTYVVSVPTELLQIVTDACRFHHEVHVHRYKILDHGNLKLLEIHSGGMTVVEDCTARPMCKESDIWTWKQLRRKEAIDAIYPEAKSYGNGKQSETYCFRGGVWAISPILTMDPSNPFCLLELCDSVSLGSCIVVLKGLALELQPAIQPGNIVTLLHAQRHAWRIPEALGQPTHLLHRLPTHIYVLQQVEQLDFCTNENDESFSSSLWTAQLSAFRGCIQKTRLCRIGDHSKGIHYVDLLQTIPEGGEVGTSSKRLFLTYFPMSTSLQLCLRPGAVIQATNIHDLGDGINFCACLRSSVHIDVLASQGPGNELSGLVFDSDCATAPFAYQNKISKSYLEFVMSGKMTAFLTTLSLPNLPRTEEWVHALLQPSLGFTKKRNVYAEFLDHGHSSRADVELCSLGCHVSRMKSPQSTEIPNLLGLSRIHQAVVTSFKQKVQRLLQNTAVAIGWTGSFSIPSSELIKELSTEKVDNPLLTGGRVSSTNRESTANSFEGATSFSISNGRVIIPVVYSPYEALPPNQSDFLLGLISIVNVSCICIGALPSSQDTRKKVSTGKVVSLPTYTTSSSQLNDSTRGSCFLLETGGSLFVAGFYLELDKVHSVPIKATLTEETFRTSILPSIGACLGPPSGELPQAFFGVLVRNSLNAYKARHGVYRGDELTVAHTEVQCGVPMVANDVSTLQTLDLKVSIPVCPTQGAVLRRVFELEWRWFPVEEQVSIALAWWMIASSDRHCALLGGGWEELCPSGTKSCPTKATMVCFPRSALKPDEKHGYIRLRCSIDNLSAFRVSVSKPPPSNDPLNAEATNDLSCSFGFIGGSKVLPGHLDCRPRRRRLGQIAHGELLYPVTSAAGIPVCSLGDVFQAACLDLRETTRRFHLAPSLVREIRGAVFMGVTYCKVQAECSKCFSPLCTPSSGVFP